jgi:hypothetical protein
VQFIVWRDTIGNGEIGRSTCWRLSVFDITSETGLLNGYEMSMNYCQKHTLCWLLYWGLANIGLVSSKTRIIIAKSIIKASQRKKINRSKNWPPAKLYQALSFFEKDHWQDVWPFDWSPAFITPTHIGFPKQLASEGWKITSPFFKPIFIDPSMISRLSSFV